MAEKLEVKELASISLGILRANVWGVILWSTIGKLLRYIIFMLPVVAFKS